MSKDPFNGNIKKDYINFVKFSLIFTTAFFFAFFVFFLYIALSNEEIEYSARISIFVLSGICFFASFLYPVISIYAIRNYSKHPKLAKLIIQPYVFKNF